MVFIAGAGIDDPAVRRHRHGLDLARVRRSAELLRREHGLIFRSVFFQIGNDVPARRAPAADRFLAAADEDHVPVFIRPRREAAERVGVDLLRDLVHLGLDFRLFPVVINAEDVIAVLVGFPRRIADRGRPLPVHVPIKTVDRRRRRRENQHDEPVRLFIPDDGQVRADLRFRLRNGILLVHRVVDRIIIPDRDRHREPGHVFVNVRADDALFLVVFLQVAGLEQHGVAAVLQCLDRRDLAGFIDVDAGQFAHVDHVHELFVVCRDLLLDAVHGDHEVVETVRLLFAGREVRFLVAGVVFVVNVVVDRKLNLLFRSRFRFRLRRGVLRRSSEPLLRVQRDNDPCRNEDRGGGDQNEKQCLCFGRFHERNSFPRALAQRSG